MAITASGFYLVTFIDLFDTTQLAVDFDLETHRSALFTNSITPNFSSDTAYGAAPYNANEVSGTGYTAGGVLLTGTTVAESPTGTVRLDADDLVWSGATLTGIRGVLTYADALAGNNALMLHNLGQDYAVTAGTFTVQWPSGGYATIDLTP